MFFQVIALVVQVLRSWWTGHENILTESLAISDQYLN